MDTQNSIEFKQSCKSIASCQLTRKKNGARAIFVLENASLHKGFIHKKKKILCCHDDSSFLLKQGKNPNDYRPDIFYEALRAILDSPLNKADMVGAVFVKADSGVIIKFKPQTRIPRTFKRFCGIMVELLEKSCVRAKDSGEVLIEVLKEPLALHMPENARIIGLSYSSEKLVDVEDYLSAIQDNSNLVFVVGTMVHGKVSKESTNDYISVSSYPLSAKCCIGLVCEALEQKWKLAHG
ncbi:Ribosomal RNA small subunit methyltransferase NEP1 [Bienertia sinuspersici]